jgi:uncharacterized membrane protein
MDKLFLAPGFYAHILNGVLLLMAIIVVYINYDSLKKLTPYNKIMLFLTFSLCIGLHGISHFILDKYYNYNPLLIQ